MAMLSFDKYTRNAQLAPMLLTLLPVPLAVAAWFPGGLLGWGGLAGVLAYCGLTILLSQLGRDLGRNKQQFLFDLWRGKPTTRMLRHHDTTLDSVTKARYHRALATAINHPFPDAAAERVDPMAADGVYESAVRYMLEATRNENDYPLVFKENVNFGFRRNYWGLKPIGILLSAAGTIMAFWPVTKSWDVTSQPIALVATSINLLLFLILLAHIRPGWVRIPADAYALRLLAACETFHPSKSSTGAGK